MRFGIAKDIITPVKPTRIACSGPFDKDYIAIHDDIYVRVLVLDDGNNKTVLIAYDLLFHDHSLNDTIAAYANEKYGIEKSAVIASYSHAHTTPAVKGYCPGAHDEQYEEFLVVRTKDCLDRALSVMYEGSIEYGTFDADFNISRRGVRNGEFANAPDENYKCDKEFFVLCVRDNDKNIRSVVTNYACHPVNYPAKQTVSAEYPGRLCQHLDMHYYGAMCMFFQSSGADVRPRPTVDPDELIPGWPWKSLSFTEVDNFAKDIAKSVINFVDSGKCKKTEAEFSSDEFELELPIDGKTLSDFKKMWKERENSPAGPERNHAYNIVNGGYNKLRDSLPLRCQTVKVSDDLYIAAMGGEPCYRVKCAVREAFSDKDFCFIGYTDACAYIVDDLVLSEGGYEPNSHLEYGLKGPFKPGLNKAYTDAFKASRERIESK